jgi:hypothetical protein
MSIKFAVKDKISGQYIRFGGRGDRTLWHSIKKDLGEARLYNKKGPATAFINQYIDFISKPHTINLNNPPPQFDFVVVQVDVSYMEL